MSALNEHARQIARHPLLGGDIDFKLCESGGARNSAATVESGFDRLRVSVVEEVVAMGPRAVGGADPGKDAGRHVSPWEFHDMLACGDGCGSRVLLDVRNCYESAIGAFRVDGLPTLIPQVRTFSELPGWIDRNLEALTDKTVLMYCTGGVRCERASAFLRERGAAFRDVVQLEGGIWRYMDAYPDGGFFKGKNFVFDERVAVSSGDGTVVGRCLACGRPWDDYGGRHRCAHCRMLMLLCPDCESLASGRLACGLCQQGGGLATGGPQQPRPARPRRKLKILCLHGFRQTGKAFRGRTCALRKKLRDVADFRFIDAPHKLIFYSKHGQIARTNSAVDIEPAALSPCSETDGCRSSQSRLGSLGTKEQGPNMPETKGHPVVKRAWLINPEIDVLPEQPASENGACWLAASDAMNHDQYKNQTFGWEESWKCLSEVLSSEQFDGIWGFSQGACIAAVVCALQEERQRLQRAEGGDSSTNDGRNLADSDESLTTILDTQRPESAPLVADNRCTDDGFDDCTPKVSNSKHLTAVRFVVLGSGYPSPVEEHKALFRRTGLLQVPSLHVFSNGIADRQVPRQDSEDVAMLFRAESRQTIVHDAGHIIPVAKTHIEEYRRFLERFLDANDEGD
ncbi:unnamed protein product [Ostreobium quekettii]|uniref:Rhodanese domain-containing protein n=1 Tax=Ostreobium quekettii TaxID=121088 RepID=A0A8S1J2T6_9CHLO|nr:unnamed protein product [Ostreobium quekettii]|eukprot:evm.model.scf_1565.1 EVM.evm.TU.scf_1565.1   scf_1565:959-2836(+)